MVLYFTLGIVHKLRTLELSPPLNAQKINVTFFLEINDPYVPYQMVCQSIFVDINLATNEIKKLISNFLLQTKGTTTLLQNFV